MLSESETDSLLTIYWYGGLPKGVAYKLLVCSHICVNDGILAK